MMVYLIAVLVYVAIWGNNSKNYLGRIEYSNNKDLERCVTVLVLAFGPFAILNNIGNTLQYINSSGAYIGSYIDDGSSSFLSICEIVFRCLIPIYLATLPKGRYKGFFFFFICTFIVCIAFGGSRARALLPAMCLIWYLSVSGFRIKRSQVAILAIAGFVLFTLVSIARGSAASWNLITQIQSDNVVFIMLANVIDYEELISDPHHSLYFLSNLINPILRYLITPDSFINGRNLEYASTSFSLDHKIMYAIAPSEFAAGRGFGSCTALEFYLFGGLLGVLLLGVAYLFCTGIVAGKAMSKPIWFIIAYWWIQAFLFSSRGSAMPDLFYLSTSLILYGVLDWMICSRGSQIGTKLENVLRPKSIRGR